jgi:multiple sugar transport system substrate-binding protein
VGKIGVLFTSSAVLTRVTEWSGGKFELKTGCFPDMKDCGHLPAGGNGAVLLTKDPKKQQAAWKFIKFATSGLGAAVVAETTGYMPPNKKANEVTLKDFYEKHPNHLIAVKQLPFLGNWYAFPGKNGLKITKVIFDDLQSITTGERTNEASMVLKDMVKEVQTLLPR